MVLGFKAIKKPLVRYCKTQLHIKEMNSRRDKRFLCFDDRKKKSDHADESEMIIFLSYILINTDYA